MICLFVFLFVHSLAGLLCNLLCVDCVVTFTNENNRDRQIRREWVLRNKNINEGNLSVIFKNKVDVEKCFMQIIETTSEGDAQPWQRFTVSEYFSDKLD